MSKPRIRLLLVDDHFFVRMGLTSSLNAEPDLRVVAEADNGLQAIKQFRAQPPGRGYPGRTEATRAAVERGILHVE